MCYMVVKQEASSAFLIGFVFRLAGCLATLLTRQLGGGTSLVADDPTMKQVIQDYIVPIVL